MPRPAPCAHATANSPHGPPDALLRGLQDISKQRVDRVDGVPAALSRRWPLSRTGGVRWRGLLLGSWDSGFQTFGSGTGGDSFFWGVHAAHDEDVFDDDVFDAHFIEPLGSIES